MLSKNTILSTAVEDEYKIIEQIGEGGCGVVYSAKNSCGKNFAIKILKENNSIKTKIKRFKNEIDFCSRINHPNIVKVLDYGLYETKDVKYRFYVMPLYDSSLRKEINNGLEPEKIINIFNQLLAGLNFAHSKGTWHRDIKPENILFDSKNGMAVIADFGIAHFQEDSLITEVKTKPTDRLANFNYASPEQKIKGSSVDGRADVYALGLILNEMFTKKVIEGSFYTKISDVNTDFAYLDSFVDLLITQDLDMRLYPIEQVKNELSVSLQKSDAKLINKTEIIQSLSNIQSYITDHYRNGSSWCEKYSNDKIRQGSIYYSKCNEERSIVFLMSYSSLNYCISFQPLNYSENNYSFKIVERNTNYIKIKIVSNKYSNENVEFSWVAEGF